MVASMMDEKGVRTKLALTMIPAWIGLISFFILAVISVIGTIPEMDDEEDNIALTYSQTFSKYDLNVTLDRDYYLLWYREDEYLGRVTISINGTIVLENLTQDQGSDLRGEIGDNRYFVLCQIEIVERSYVNINKTGGGGFSLLGSYEFKRDLFLEFGLAILVSSLVLFSPGLVGIYILDRKMEDWAREEKRRRRAELSKVKFDLKNPRQVSGALLAFILGPITTAFALAIPFYLLYEWYNLLQLPLVLLAVASFIIGYYLFYDRKMFGPGGELSFKSTQVDRSKSLCFYQCHACQRVNRFGILELSHDLTCGRCGTVFFLEGHKVGEEKDVRMACPRCRSILLFPIRPGEVWCPNCGMPLSMRVKQTK